MSHPDPHPTPVLLMTEARHYDVRYSINPWMRPEAWAADPAAQHHRAEVASDTLREACRAAGARVELIPGTPGQPDMVFPANAAVVLDGVALMARFRHPERQGEEAPFLQAFENLRQRGLLRDVATLTEGVFHEGAGDSIWDARRGLFWSGFGPRSTRKGAEAVARFFRQDAAMLELASERFYHLDTCFCPLSGGEVLYYPPAFTPSALERIRAELAPEQRIEASAEDAAGFCVNAVNLGREVVMAKAPPRLRAVLEERGYALREVDLSPFILSGGGAYCMTLRLDRSSAGAAHQRVAA